MNGLLDEAPPQRVRAVLSMGANLGDRFATLQAALDGVHAFEGIRVVAASPVVETDPVGGPDQPDFYNAVLLIDTRVAPLELLDACQQVERDHGRVRSVRWGPRTLDLDVIIYDDLVAETPQLQLPHPRAAERAFVLSPWLAVDPSATLPGGDGARVSVRDLLAVAKDRDGVRAVPGKTLVVPR
ncbi:MAG TPA: 2-amino-4-hydroxy-6-hydroxymethyldihydropteridine diphosphokinase [Kineosporiaceae bacterium]|nr:2-amino-4-hydroxy-6-hydroxymethyldihydropteridine diphosphokinase [Kineosporiaceae bacterium]